MIKKILFAIVLCSLLVSCTTSNYVNSNQVVTSTNLTVEEKFRLLGFDSVRANSIESYYDGGQWSDRLVELIESARNYILISSFLASECEWNRDIYDAIIRKAEQGIPVYFVYDGVSYLDYTETKNYLRPIGFLKESGVHLHEFNPLSFSRLVTNPFGLFLREHRKIVVIDGRWTAVGGMNFNYISLQPLSDGGQRDSMYCFDSPEMAEVLKRDYVSYWNSVSYDEIDGSALVNLPYETQPDTVRCWVVQQSRGKTKMPELIASLFYSAKEEILMIPMYPIADDGMFKWIEDASSRDVEMEQIIANYNSSGKNGYYASMYIEKDLMDAGLYSRNEYDNEKTVKLLHEKLFIIDSRYIVVGSVNFNHRSMLLSEEVAVVIDSPELAKAVREHYMTFRDNTYPVTEDIAEENRNLSNAIKFAIMYFGG